MPPVDPRVEVLAELRKQTAYLAHIENKIAAVEMVLVRILDSRAGEADSSQRAPVNDAVTLGPRGDPIIKAKSPRDWLGADMTGKHFSECPPEYLDLLAERYDYFATKDDQTPEKIRYAKLDASRARAWAAKLRAGYVPPAAAPTVSEAGREPTW